MKLPIQNSSAAFVSDDSRECSSGTAFLLTPLSAKYASDAKALGCSEFITADKLCEHIDLSGIKIIGVTGTNGKTTTTAAIYSMLLDLGHKTALCGTRGFFIGEERVEAKGLTTPMQLDNFARILTAKERGCEFFVMEVSSHAIAQRRIEGLDFALRVHTNITQDHLDFHKTFEAYAQTKNSFLQGDGIKLVNIDDPHLVCLQTDTFTYAVEKQADYRVTAYGLQDGICASLDCRGVNAHFCSGLYGFFNLYNLLCAVAAVHIVTGNDPQKICESLENFGGVAGRMQAVSDDPVVIVDFAHTPDGIAKVMDAMQGRALTVVFGAGGDRDPLKRPLMGREASLRANKLIITSDNPRSEDAAKIADQIISGVVDSWRAKIVLDRKEAIFQALSEQQPGEVVMILGKGDEEYQIVGEEKIPFDDCKIAKEILDDLAQRQAYKR